MLQGSILQYFRPALKLPPVFKTFVLSIYEWPLKTGLTVTSFQNLESALKEKEKEVEHLRHQETALQKELTKLQQELDSTRAALKASDPKVIDQGQSDREGWT